MEEWSYARKREAYIQHLEKRVARLEKEVNEAYALAADAVSTRDATMLRLILCGALQRPTSAPAEVDSQAARAVILP